MRDFDAVTGCEQPEFLRKAAIVVYTEMRLGSLYVAELDSNRPVNFIRLLRFLMRKGKSREDAEDLIQEAMLHVHAYARSAAVMNDDAFLRRVVQNLAIDQYRHDRSRVSCEVPIEDVDRQISLIATSPMPDQILDDQQRLDALVAHLDAVNPRMRKIYLAHRSGYTYAEIGAHMGVSAITVKRHIARAQAAILKADD